MYAVIPRTLGIDVSTASSEPNIIPIFPGWNVWNIWQVNDLDFNPLNIGITPERQLRIWVEDQIRENAGAAEVADPVALKGSQIQVLPGLPTGLKIMMRKDQVTGCEGDGCAGPLMVVNGPATLKTVRFFNRSNSQTSMPWPHDNNYLVDSTYIPDTANPTTAGPGPGTILSSAADAASATVNTLTKVALVGGIIYLAVMFGPPILEQLKKSMESKSSSA
jgi:hypothetical protein